MVSKGLPLLWAAISLLLSLAGVALAIRIAMKAGVMDVPNERSSHAVPVPRMGGVPLVLATILACIGFALSVPSPAGSIPHAAVVSLAFAAAMAVLGFRDDLSPLSPLFRFVVQTGAALAACLIAARGNAAPVLLGVAIPGWAWVPAAAIWVVWMMNLYNFMDGIDGIAGGEALVGGLFLSAVFFAEGEPGWGAANLIVASASAGFLRYNWSPARIFLGDAGSMFLGAFFGIQSIAAGSTTAVPLVVLILPFSNFILDATVTLLRRMRRGEKWYRPHRSHFYQRMTDLGLSHASVTSIELLSMAASCLAAAGCLRAGGAVKAALVLLTGAMFLACGVAIARRGK
ncbi:MAG TPA: glycosyltransferase family 4 protein [Candidatus Deferrimicrobiaceae bacterium]